MLDSAAAPACDGRECAAVDAIARLAAIRADSVTAMLDAALDEAVALSGSEIGYLYHYDDEEQLFRSHAWSSEVAARCSVPDPALEYRLHGTGCWGDVVREGTPIIINDYGPDHPRAKGVPQGHVPMSRWMSVPVTVEGRIRAVAGVANKATPYTGRDVQQLTILMTAAWTLADRLRAELELRAERAQVRRLTAALVFAGAEARKRHATEVHDLISQPLAAAGIRLGLAASSSDPDRVAAELETAIDLVREALRASRAVTSALSPQVLDQIGLPAALTTLAEDLGHDGFTCHAAGSADVGQLGPEIERFAYDAACELLDNVVNHSGATASVLAWDVDHGRLSLTVADNGAGFTVSESEGRPVYDGLGLFGLYERAEFLGGSVSVVSAPGEGTLVTVSVPVEAD